MLSEMFCVSVSCSDSTPSCSLPATESRSPGEQKLLSGEIIPVHQHRPAPAPALAPAGEMKSGGTKEYKEYVKIFISFTQLYMVI